MQTNQIYVLLSYIIILLCFDLKQLPLTTQTRAKPKPVFPEVASITVVSPGTNFPSFSASSTIFTQIRSLIEPPGLKNSNFATKSQNISITFQRVPMNCWNFLQTSHLMSSAWGILFNLIRGVFPVVAKMSGKIFAAFEQLHVFFWSPLKLPNKTVIKL